jgi:hypothetical protein
MKKKTLKNNKMYGLAMETIEVSMEAILVDIWKKRREFEGISDVERVQALLILFLIAQRSGLYDKLLAFLPEQGKEIVYKLFEVAQNGK